MQI
ncbi:hypothetical protein VCHENC02_3277A, partial [Vibrio harveyi]|jgi:T-complex protein 1 subunit zeta